MGRCATTQGILGKRNFEFMSYGSRVIGRNIKWPHGGAITALSGNFGAEVHGWHPRNGTGDLLFTDKLKHPLNAVWMQGQWESECSLSAAEYSQLLHDCSCSPRGRGVSRPVVHFSGEVIGWVAALALPCPLIISHFGLWLIESFSSRLYRRTVNNTVVNTVQYMFHRNWLPKGCTWEKL